MAVLPCEGEQVYRLIVCQIGRHENDSVAPSAPFVTRGNDRVPRHAKFQTDCFTSVFIATHRNKPKVLQLE
ncbi:hypothetical protein EYF80_029697 [Liparis tanakae]|uniref:Uncharacterized protein n=1 Tax=Liparis tanakae TaxID=230148 RepID=A0A4Z2H4D0_9TELE|nr:hypothetical protein EYF80_029697 [Liparis tanakae]